MNVLFIVADDLNCALGAYGDTLVNTPNLDRLAEEGAMFTNAHCQYPLCGPSRASFMTGLYADQTRVRKNNVYLRSAVPDVVTLSQRFRQRGYEAVRIGKIFHYDNPGTIGTSGIDDRHSWDRTINPYGRDKREEHLIHTLKPRRYGGTLSWLAMEGTDEEQTDGIGATEACEQLDGFAERGTPFFLAVGFYRPHTPFAAPKAHFDAVDREAMVVPESYDELLEALPEPAVKSIRAMKTQVGLPTELSKEIIQAYRATVSFVDAQVGRVLDRLQETGLDRNTLVVFLSDHGYHLGEHGHWQKQTLFEEGTRVPLIIRPPAGHPSGPIAAPVELVDLYPTIADYAGLEVPGYVQGLSLRRLMDQEADTVRGSALTVWRKGKSIATDRYRLTSWGQAGELGLELYDHQADPDELRNLALDGEKSPLMDSLVNVLERRWLASLRAPEGLGRQILDPPVAQKTPHLTPGDLYRLDGSIETLKTEE
jgi:arylsulfatase A-like enzyme